MNTKWTDEFLDSMRQIGDPPADKVVAAVIESGELEAYDAMMKHLLNNRDEIPDSLPPIVQDFFEQTKILPAWAETEKIRKGEEIFDLHGPEMIIMLFFMSLPYAYATTRGSNVLVISTGLTKQVHRRIVQTARFIIDVMQAGGLGPEGRGIRSAQKVRLLHASIRYYIANDKAWNPKWNPAWGLPINQEDLAGTMLDFTTSVMRGLERLKLKLSPEEADAYLHCWKVVGHIMGICPELMPEDVPEAYALTDAILGRQQGESAAGKLLVKDLIGFTQRFMPPFFQGLPTTATRYLSGDHVADFIDVGPYDWTLLVLKLQIFLFDLAENFKDRFPGIKKYTRFLTWNLIEGVVSYEEGGQVTSFEIPDRSRKHWGFSKERRRQAPGR